MKAMILAAGRGERMRPLTDYLPKPLLSAGGKTLIEHHLQKLEQAGIRDIVINLAYRGEQIRKHLGDGTNYNVTIHYSDEGDTALETGGGIVHALPLLGENPFLLINSDIWTNYPLHKLSISEDVLAHLVMIDNPEHNPEGDFALTLKRLTRQNQARLTYSGLGIYRPEFFRPYPAGKRPLLEILNPAIDAGKISGEYFQGEWLDIGTPQRLRLLQQKLSGT